MIGAIAGDIIGSIYEGKKRHVKTTNFPLFQDSSHFTDDTVMTAATAYALLHTRDYARAYKDFGLRYPDAGYGSSFRQWLYLDMDRPYNSWGNGSAMRVSPVGMLCADVDSVLEEAKRSAEVTHNHPEGVKGAQAVALAVYLARHGAGKPDIQQEIETRFGYDLHQTLKDIRPRYKFDVSCPGSVPQSIIAFLESDSLESAIRNAVSLGGDSDTMACIAGSIAEPFYREIPDDLRQEVRRRLPQDLLDLVDAFYQAVG